MDRETEERIISIINDEGNSITVSAPDNSELTSSNISSFDTSDNYFSTISSSTINGATTAYTNIAYDYNGGFRLNRQNLENLIKKYCPFPPRSEQADLWKQGFQDAFFILNEKQLYIEDDNRNYSFSKILNEHEQSSQSDSSYSHEESSSDDSGIEYDVEEDSENNGED